MLAAMPDIPDWMILGDYIFGEDLEGLGSFPLPEPACFAGLLVAWDALHLLGSFQIFTKYLDPSMKAVCLSGRFKRGVMVTCLRQCRTLEGLGSFPLPEPACFAGLLVAWDALHLLGFCFLDVCRRREPHVGNP
jgi:hypothetical protein